MNARGAAPPSIDLAGTWEFALSEASIPVDASAHDALSAPGIGLRAAVVPGNIELDLARHGEIPDPEHGMNVVALRWLERMHVFYRRTFTAPARGAAAPYLVFEGVDCDARIRVNDVVVGETRNMLIEHRIPVGHVLRDGEENELVVEIAPVGLRAAAGIGTMPPGLQAEGGGYESLRIRKAPHAFGWDIMPRALSAGIWRGVHLDYEAPERIVSVWLDTERIDPVADRATLALHHEVVVELDPAVPVELIVHGRCGERTFRHRSRLLFGAGVMRFDVDQPARWWPRGRGRPDLYEVEVEVVRAGITIDQRSFRHGIRTVELERTSLADAAGSGEFRFIVNGEPVFILGTNWVPLDMYHSEDLDRIPRALALAEELGCNMIRCWGGNVYEHERFFDGCDEAGILVWQDFAMACAIYPQDGEFQAELAAEVRQVVRRLRQHPCLAIWAGDNECDEQYVYKSRRRDPNQNVLTRRVIPEVLRAEDPSRPYLPSSPYVDEAAYAAGGRSLPEDHLWGPRIGHKHPFYTESVAHFASEIGYNGSPSVSSLRRFLSPDRLWPYRENPEWLLHATSPFPGVDTHDYRLELLASQVRALFGEVPTTLEAFVEASQACQAEALKYFIELFRAGKWRRTGIIWWNLIDGWPQFSDAVVDHYWQRKPAFEVVKRAQQPLHLVLREPEDGRQMLVLCNDTRDDLRVTFDVRDVDGGGSVLRGSEVALRDAVTNAGWVGHSGDQAMYRIDWRSPMGDGHSHYLAGSPPFELGRYRHWIARVEP